MHGATTTLADVPPRVRAWFAPRVAALRYDAPGAEPRWRHVSRRHGRPTKDGSSRGWQVQMKIDGTLVYLARADEAELGALLAAAAVVDPALRAADALLAWLERVCASPAAFDAWAEAAAGAPMRRAPKRRAPRADERATARRLTLAAADVTERAAVAAVAPCAA
jgi:hypothetical protein